MPAEYWCPYGTPKLLTWEGEKVGGNFVLVQLPFLEGMLCTPFSQKSLIMDTRSEKDDDNWQHFYSISFKTFKDPSVFFFMGVKKKRNVKICLGFAVLVEQAKETHNSKIFWTCLDLCIPPCITKWHHRACDPILLYKTYPKRLCFFVKRKIL